MKLQNAQIDFFLNTFFRHLLDDDEVTEIAVNQPFIIHYEKNGQWISETNEQMSFNYCRNFAVAVASEKSDDFSDTKPILSATLPTGDRIQFVCPPATSENTISITLRKPSYLTRNLNDYDETGYFKQIHPITTSVTVEDKALLKLKNDKKYYQFLEQAVKDSKNIVIAGETGSGKTTFMKALIEAIDTKERLITIEDVPELFLPHHPNKVHLFYPSESKSTDIITSATLLKSCLRMKPDRILLAELRSGETYDWINVASSGHGGSITSCHAGSCELTFERLALMVMQNPQGRMLPYATIKKLLYQVVDIIIHVTNDHDFGRHITEIYFEPSRKFEV